MVRRRSDACGFSLIEMMFTLLLVGVLGMMAGPSAISWLHLSDIQRAKGQLMQAYGSAKAAALRNSYAIESGEGEAKAIVAIRVIVEPKDLKLDSCPAADGSCLVVVGCPKPDNDGCETVLWGGQLPMGVSLVFDGPVEFDSAGGLKGSGKVQYKISKGKELKDGKLF